VGSGNGKKRKKTTIGTLEKKEGVGWSVGGKGKRGQKNNNFQGGGRIPIILEKGQ